MSWSIIIGNGFTIDAYSQTEISYNPSYPWKWPLKSPYHNDEPLINLFPKLRDFLNGQGSYQDLNIFESLNPIVEITRNRPIQEIGSEPSKEDLVHIEACHYLRLAYSWYSRKYSQDELSAWRWLKWFKENGHNIVTVLSFNYDLVLEKTMRLANLGKVYGESSVVPIVDIMMKGAKQEPYWDEKPNDKNVVHIAKPHGSCNFTGWAVIQRSNNGETKPIYPQEGNYLFRDDSMLKILEDDELYQPTYSADLVLPGEWSWWNEVASTKLKWVQFQKNVFIEESLNAKYLLIIGFGCSEPDRDEFSNLISRLNEFETIYVIDPNPKEHLLDIVTDHTENIITLTSEEFLNM